ncbi:unnamed protein product [marine sediment metagenome]|uniref:MT-A70 family protein n=1 Tax=marine sediment metagenome TaxID=412755 RepID=X1KYT4_9ZZZZ
MKKYQIIYADPPWQYKRWMYKNNRFCIDLKYNTMTTLDICNLPVKSISDKDCILFLWSPGPKINEALIVIDCWGFKYKSIAFTWVKRNKRGATLISSRQNYRPPESSQGRVKECPRGN